MEKGGGECGTIGSTADFFKQRTSAIQKLKEEVKMEESGLPREQLSHALLTGGKRLCMKGEIKSVRSRFQRLSRQNI